MTTYKIPYIVIVKQKMATNEIDAAISYHIDYREMLINGFFIAIEHESADGKSYAMIINGDDYFILPWSLNELQDYINSCDKFDKLLPHNLGFKS